VFAELEEQHPHLQETLLAAMGNVELKRLLDPRYLDLDGSVAGEAEAELLPILGQEELSG
jgi:hypothetical protein